METLEYKNYRIEYFPKAFKLSAASPLDDVSSEVKIFRNEKLVEILRFIIPIPQSFTSKLTQKEIIEKAIEKTKEVVDENFEALSSREFRLENSQFTEVVDTSGNDTTK